MPFVKNKVSVTLDTGEIKGSGSYSHLWARCKVVAETNGDNVNYTVTMTNGNTKGETTRPMVSLGVKIDAQTVVKEAYYGSDWTKFPLKHNSTKTGTITTRSKNDEEIGVTIRMLVSKDFNDFSTEWENSLKREYLNRTWYTNVKAEKPTITDNGNNTFTVTGVAGTAGTNNKVNSTTVYYQRSSDSIETAISGLSNANNPAGITCQAGVVSQIVYAFTKVDGKYNDATSERASLAITNYQAPSSPGKPKISYSKNKLTVKENWTYTWDAAKATNLSSPIDLYRIRIYKNGTIIKGLKLDSNDSNIIRLGAGTNDWVDRANTSCKVIFNPIDLGFKAGDTVQLGVYARAKNGKGASLWSGGGTTQSLSETSTVQNAGVMHVKVNNTWKEGQVYVKVNNTWKEAESVYVKVNNVWKEAT